jgi:hypothetical protein
MGVRVFSRRFSATVAGVLAGALLPAVATAADSISDLKAVNQNNTLHITATTDDAAVWNNTQLLIDTDADAKTGYALPDAPGQGFDYMVEGSTVYRFQGTDPAAWDWKKLGTATRKVDGKSIAFDISVPTLDAESVVAGSGIVLRSLSSDYQHVLAVSSVAKLTEGKDNAADQTAGQSPAESHGLTADFKQDGADLVVKVSAGKAADLDTVLIFFDTDEDSGTGFDPPADPHYGFEQMIQGESLSAHTGDARDGWSWKTVAPVKRTVEGSSAEYRFNAALLKSSKIRAAVWQMSPDWQTRTDRFPADDAGTTEVVLDASKLHAEVVRPPLPFAAPRADRSLPARERFAKAASYCCYYGADHTSDLSHFDAVILHTPAQTAEDVKKLSDLGVVTIGYVSVGEDDQLHVGNGKGPGGKASWYFDKNSAGQPDKNGTWNSWYANAADPDWRANRVAEAKRLCETADNGLGFDGIFLDTIETCDSYPQSRAGMTQLVAELRAALPEKVIVMNRGFSLLKESQVSSRIDGLMFESFSDSYDFDSKSYIQFAPQDMDATREVMVKDVLPAMKLYPLKVLALDYCMADQTDRIQTAFDRAAAFGMVPGVAPIFLDDVFDTTKIVARADDKYLSKLATPQSLAMSLSEERNGFPAGTRIEPSSCFLGYSVAAIVDGIKDRQTLSWSKAAWASAEDAGQSQQLEFSFPGSITGGNLLITFAFDNGQWRTSRQLRCEVKASSTSEWVSVPVTIDAHSARCTLPPTAISQLRLVQEAGQGSSDRPDLMWIAQVERTR